MSKRKRSESHEFKMDEQSKSSRLEVLNDDCLREILKFFEPHELLRLYGVSDQLDNLLNNLRSKYTNFKFLHQINDVKWDLENFRDALTFMGPNLKSVVLGSGRLFHMSHSVIFYLLHQFCPKLELLELKYFDINFLETRNEWIRLTKNLKSISLIQGSYCDELGMVLGNSDQLENLSIDSSNIDDYFFIHFKNLKSLSINRVNNFRTKDFLKILKKNKNLQKVECHKKDCVNDDIINFMVDNSTSLKDISLDIWSGDNSDRLGDVPNLKKLHFGYCPTFIRFKKELFEKLRNKNIIEELRISHIFGENLLSEEIIISISMLTSLKSLELPKVTDIELKKLQNLKQLECVAFKEVKISSNGLFDFIINLHNLIKLQLSFSKIHNIVEFFKKLAANLKIIRRQKLEITTYYREEMFKPEIKKLLNENRHILSINLINN